MPALAASAGQQPFSCTRSIVTVYYFNRGWKASPFSFLLDFKETIIVWVCFSVVSVCALLSSGFLRAVFRTKALSLSLFPSRLVCVCVC